MSTDTVLAPLTREEAVRLTERIHLGFDRVEAAWIDLGKRVKEAYDRDAHVALGYESWEAYAAAEVRPYASVEIDARRDAVGVMTDAGMSTRAIAPVFGVGVATVHRDQVFHSGTPAPVIEQPALFDAPDAPLVPTEPEPEPEPEPTRIKGLDGKTYIKQKYKELVSQERDDAYWDRKNAEQEVKAACEALDVLTNMLYPTTRARIIAEFPEHSEATRPNARELFSPVSMRQIADALNTLANELEESL